jgi:hypothetical protein
MLAVASVTGDVNGGFLAADNLSKCFVGNRDYAVATAD